MRKVEESDRLKTLMKKDSQKVQKKKKKILALTNVMVKHLWNCDYQWRIMIKYSSYQLKFGKRRPET